MLIGKHETHPASDAFPLMVGPELAELVKDIKRHGQLDDIVLHDGKILDGRNRYRACIEGRVPPRFRKYDGDDPLGFVISVNIRRRHLNESQRAIVAGRLATLPHGRHKTGKSAGLMTQSDAAARLNVGERTVREAQAVLKTAIPEVIEAVERGELAVTAAAELARLGPDEQRERLAAAAAAATKRARDAIIHRDTKPQNDETIADPVTQMLRVTVRALEQLGATVGKRKADDDGGRFELELAFGGHQYALALQPHATERAA